MTFEQFKTDRSALGFDEILEREWKPGEVLAEHVHPFDVDVRVARGEMWLTCAGTTRHVREGESFEIARDTPHAERYGAAAGATLWVARKHPLGGRGAAG